jgi:hypothetical protein
MFFATGLLFASILLHQSDAKPTVRTVALLPFSLAGSTDGGREAANKAIELVFAKANCEVLPQIGTKKIWEEDLKMPQIELAPENENDLKPMPSAADLLRLGRILKADYACAGRAKWHTKSVWVSFGPKTKADCTMDVLIVDVAKAEIVLDAKGIKGDSTRKESGLETAGALFLSMGITGLSGGPKDPHHRRAGVMAVGLAFDPWLQTLTRKIGG